MTAGSFVDPNSDIIGRGLAGRPSLETALAWIDAVPALPAVEEVAAAEAGGRVLAALVPATRDHPEFDRAAVDGYAVRAADTIGAGGYSPLGPASAVVVPAGRPLPPGTDAVVPVEAVQPAPDGGIEVTAPLAEGEGVERAGRRLSRGAPGIDVTGRPLRPEQLGLLAELGAGTVFVFARPRVRLAVRGAKPPDADSLTPMLRGLIARDGGVLAPGQGAADLIVMAGRSGVGVDDDGAARLAADGGWLDLHGLALRPGGSAGLGWLGGVPVLLLPGEPLACLTVWELLAARLLRRLAGRADLSCHPAAGVLAGRKFVSRIGSVDVVRVRLVSGRAEPIGSLEGGGLAAAARADGFVVIPAAREGYAPGEAVTVHFHGANDP